jgi:hypothetical protein
MIRTSAGWSPLRSLEKSDLTGGASRSQVNAKPAALSHLSSMFTRGSFMTQLRLQYFKQKCALRVVNDAFAH